MVLYSKNTFVYNMQSLLLNFLDEVKCKNHENSNFVIFTIFDDIWQPWLDQMCMPTKLYSRLTTKKSIDLVIDFIRCSIVKKGKSLKLLKWSEYGYDDDRCPDSILVSSFGLGSVCCFWLFPVPVCSWCCSFVFSNKFLYMLDVTNL